MSKRLLDDLDRKRTYVDGHSAAVVSHNPGLLPVPLAAADEPRTKNRVWNCGPFEFSAVTPTTHFAHVKSYNYYVNDRDRAIDIAQFTGSRRRQATIEVRIHQGRSFDLGYLSEAIGGPINRLDRLRYQLH